MYENIRNDKYIASIYDEIDKKQVDDLYANHGWNIF